MAAVQAEQEGYDVEEVLKSMEEVPKGIRKVVGKTIPIEVHSVLLSCFLDNY